MDQSEALALLQERIAGRKMHSIEPYPWQKAFFAGGKTQRQAMVMAANQVGKSLCAALETAYHATGLYPDWWEGYVITDQNPVIWVSSLTNEVSRDISQLELLGPVGNWGTGLIPKDLIIDIRTRQAGISDVVDTIRVSNARGGITTIKTKVAEQGWKKYQGTKVSFIWQDEEPDDFKVFTESMTRTANTDGRIVVTFTPLSGPTQLVQHFVDKSEAEPALVGLYTATWDDAPHMSDAKKAELRATFPAHELEARTMGIPMMGEGALFPIPDADIMCEPFRIPSHYARVCGVDFGWDHPAAGAWLAIDRDTDTVYLYDAYKQSKQFASFHGSAIKNRDPHGKISVMWPHDGVNEKGTGTNYKTEYEKEGVLMFPFSARYDDEVGSTQKVEPIVAEIYTRMVEGRFKVFNNAGGQMFLDEKRGLHRKDGKIKAIKDDIFSATRYALMMLRYARADYIRSAPSSGNNSTPIFKSSRS